MAFSTSSSSISAEINVTPLIDVLLVLIIIFLVIAPAASHGLISELPQGHGTTASGQAPVMIEVSAGLAGQPPGYRVAHRQVTYAELRSQVGALLATRSDRTVYLRADRALSYRQVAEVVGESQSAGAAGVVLYGGN